MEFTDLGDDEYTGLHGIFPNIQFGSEFISS